MSMMFEMIARKASEHMPFTWKLGGLCAYDHTHTNMGKVFRSNDNLFLSLFLLFPLLFLLWQLWIPYAEDGSITIWNSLALV